MESDIALNIASVGRLKIGKPKNLLRLKEVPTNTELLPLSTLQRAKRTYRNKGLSYIVLCVFLFVCLLFFGVCGVGWGGVGVGVCGGGGNKRKLTAPKRKCNVINSLRSLNPSKRMWDLLPPTKDNVSENDSVTKHNSLGK